MKTRNFFLIHMYLVRNGHYNIANWLLKEVVRGERPEFICCGLCNDYAWHVSSIATGNGYSIRLTY
jgi:hypothetical protein